MAKLKRLAMPSDDAVEVFEPVSSDELLDRHLDYPVLSPRRFAKKYNKLFEPVEFMFNGQVHKIQFNYCVNPYCLWFGQPQVRFEHIKNNFMQTIRRRLSILERPLVTARGGGKSYIYANFNPKYAQMAVTILRTYYNFCLVMNTKGKGELTPAQQLGLTDKQFTLNDILYFK